MMLLESVWSGPPSPGHMSRRCHTLTWREITLFITSLVTLGRAAVNCYDSLARGAGEPLHYPSLPGPSSASPWVFNSMFWPSCAQHPRSCLHFVSDICMLGSCQSRCSSHLTIGRSDGPRLNICQNFLQRHFCGDGSSLWHSLHNIAPSVTSFYQSARHGGRPTGHIRHPWAVNPAGVTRSSLRDTRVPSHYARGSRLAFSPHPEQWLLRTRVRYWNYPQILYSGSVNSDSLDICLIACSC